MKKHNGSSLLVTVLDTDGGSGADAVLILVLAYFGSASGTVSFDDLGVGMVIAILFIVVEVDVLHPKLADALLDGDVQPFLIGDAGSAKEAPELATVGTTAGGAGVAGTTDATSASRGSSSTGGLVAFVVIVVKTAIQVEKLGNGAVDSIDEGRTRTAQTAGKLAVAASCATSSITFTGVTGTASSTVAGSTTATTVGTATASAAASAAGVEASPGLATAALAASHCRWRCGGRLLLCSIVAEGDDDGIAGHVCARSGSIVVDGRHDEILGQ